MKDFMGDELGHPRSSTGAPSRRNWTHCGFARRLTPRRRRHAAARRRLPMVAVDGATPLIGEHGAVKLLDAFEGRRIFIAYYFMWTLPPCAGAVRGVHFLYIAGPRAVLYSFSRRHLRHVLPRPVRRERPVPRLHELGDALVFGPPGLARDPLGWTPDRHNVHRLLPATRSNVFETYWTTIRGSRPDNSYRLLDLTVYGRQERWEDLPTGWPQRSKGEHNYRADGRPIVQWPRLKAGYSDDLGTGKR